MCACLWDDPGKFQLAYVISWEFPVPLIEPWWSFWLPSVRSAKAFLLSACFPVYFISENQVGSWASCYIGRICIFNLYNCYTFLLAAVCASAWWKPLCLCLRWLMNSNDAWKNLSVTFKFPCPVLQWHKSMRELCAR